MPFCESCRAEYEPSTEVCAECNQPLVDALPDAGSSSEMTDVYVCHDGRLAELADLRHRQVAVMKSWRARGPAHWGTTRCVSTTR